MLKSFYEHSLVRIQEINMRDVLSYILKMYYTILIHNILDLKI